MPRRPIMVMVMKTVVTSILLANLNIRDLLNILLKGSFCAVTELISMITGIQFPLEACSSPTTVQVSHPPTHSCPISRKRKRVFKEVTITMEMKTPNAGGIASITLTRTRSPCALWSQSGSDSWLRHFHPIENSRHAFMNSKTLENAQYAHWTVRQHGNWSVI